MFSLFESFLEKQIIFLMNHTKHLIFRLADSQVVVINRCKENSCTTAHIVPFLGTLFDISCDFTFNLRSNYSCRKNHKYSNALGFFFFASQISNTCADLSPTPTWLVVWLHHSPILLILVFVSRLLFSKVIIDAVQGYIKEARVARLHMWDLIFPFVINPFSPKLYC